MQFVEISSSKPILKNEYKLLKVLQKRAYGNYYLGTSVNNPENRWAIKEVNLGKSSEREEIFTWFCKIADKYTQLTHPLLAPPCDYFLSDNFAYIIFKFVPGHRLEEIFQNKKKPFTVEQTSDFAIKVGNALDYLHKNNLKFQDLNPSNVIITPEGNIKLTDFGLGKMLAIKDKKQTLWAYPGYTPPEQLENNVTPDERADIYALGIMIFQMLTLKDPNELKGLYDLKKKIKITSDEDMNLLIDKATSDDPNERYRTMKEFLNDAQKLGSGNLQPINPEQESWLRKLAREFTRSFKKSS
jgi:serine/threonine-protein kinase